MSQDLAIGDQRRIVDDLDRLGVTRGFRADEFVVSGRGRTAGIARQDLFHPAHVLVDAL
jgi:hypothetical protein